MTKENRREEIQMLKFIVLRTSRFSDEQPCEEAFEDDGRWFLLIENLEALEKFIRKYGSVVIRMTEKGTNFLEIYDAYRE